MISTNFSQSYKKILLPPKVCLFLLICQIMSKYNRTYHLPFSPGSTSDDKIAKSFDSFINVPIIITEKLDGENNAMTKNGVYARSHATFTTSKWSEEVRKIHKEIGKYIPDDVYLFGEGMGGIHSIEYKNLKSFYYLFGIRENNRWFSWNEVEEYSFLLDIPTVPVLFKGVISTENELKNLVETLSSSPSKLNGECEGVVIRIEKDFDDIDFSSSIMKWVRKSHIKTNKHWTRNWKKATLNYE